MDQAGQRSIDAGPNRERHASLRIARVALDTLKPQMYLKITGTCA
jgi:hypothetical protein